MRATNPKSSQIADKGLGFYCQLCLVVLNCDDVGVLEVTRETMGAPTLKILKTQPDRAQDNVI